MNLAQTIERTPLVFLDLETTGLDAEKGECVCEIGALRIRESSVSETFHTLVNPGKKMPEEAFRIHNISDEDLRSAPFFPDVAGKLKAFLDGVILCAYNARFDVGFLDAEFRKIGLPLLSLPILDVYRMARQTLLLDRYTLAAVATHFHIEPSGAHRAVEDASVTFQVFEKMREALALQGVWSLKDFLTLFGLPNSVFFALQEKKVACMAECIEKDQPAKVRWFSRKAGVKTEVMIPSRITKEECAFIFLFRAAGGKESRISCAYVLDIEKVHSAEDRENTL
ncbi:MAG: hypothetical protein GF333_01730 [Candidatus Omnitrophica bacterium]|nr:hypothetical protein [Candidatus Omnitrophota bacterium]